MADNSTILSLPLILPAQAQKHVTHNEALRVLDVVVQLAVKTRNLITPPALPGVGDRHIVATGASAAWAGQAGKIALFEDGLWQFFTPLTGWRAYVEAEATVANFDGALWKTAADAPLVVAQLGVSATPDATNRLTVSAPATLLNNAGAGHQLKINKASTGDTASLLFQTAWSGRAEMGLAGTDDFAVKVSPDGSAFYTGLSVAATDGQVTLPAPLQLGGQAIDPAGPDDGTVWLNTTTGAVMVRSVGVSHAVAAPLADGNRGDVTVAGADWRIDPAVKYGLQIALNNQIFFN
jgi:hypothetical protein